MKLIWFISYNFIFYPLFFVTGLIFSLFNLKFRRGVSGRFSSQIVLKKFFNSIPNTADIYWFHAASLGEFYQVKPVLEGLKNVEPKCVAVVSFSSPSGYDNAKSDDIDLRIYMPFDFLWSVRRALKITRPKKVIFASQTWMVHAVHTISLNPDAYSSFYSILESEIHHLPCANYQ